MVDGIAMTKNLEKENILAERFKQLAPGSHKHCMTVAGLCESIAKETGLNPELLLNCGFFHDVGKIFNPLYFIENQNGTNYHDELNNPLISFQLISRHVSDSVLLLQQYDFNPELIKIVSEHHGDSIMKYFHNVYCKTNPGMLASESSKLFRYRSCKPSCIESTILMICDVIEATARSKFTGKIENNNVIETLVNNCCDDLINDGQLDNLKIGILKKTKSILINELNSIYHNRINYPEEDSSDDNKTIGEIRI